jgi:FkbM family methyltransferase
MKVREDTLDLFVIKEQSCYKDLSFKDCIVLDIGGNIGAFANYAIMRGAKSVISVEPEIDNYRLLVENTKDLNVISHNACAVSNNAETIQLFVNKGRNKGLHSTVIRRGRDVQIASCLNINNLIEDYKPAIVKVDIEGGEYTLFENMPKIHACVTQIAVELHLKTKERRTYAKNLIAFVKDNGFVFSKMPDADAGNWTVLLIANR